MAEEKQSACCAADLEALCAALPLSVERTAARLEETYYVRLAEEAKPNFTKEPHPAAELLESEVREELETLRRVSKQLSAAYQRTAVVEDELSARLRDMHTSRDRKWYALNPPANAAIDLEETRQKHFAQGLGIYKILLIFAVGSFAGVIVEMLWCLATRGYIESRAGLVYGPFNPVYGAGAVLLTVFLYKYRNRGAVWSFLGGFVVGSALEYFCSWAQETVFGSVSWDYSAMPLNLNGRICFTYSLFWGALGVLWIKDLYPRMAKWILKIPNKTGKPFTWAVTVFFIVNALISGLAVARWSERVAGNPTPNSFGAFLDERFPDERMERIFANMQFQS